MEEQHYSICWNCRRSFECLQAEAISTKTCPTFEERSKPPGPARPPTRDLSRRLWANTPDHLHPKPWTSTDPKSQEIAALRDQLAAELQRAEKAEAERNQLATWLERAEAERDRLKEALEWYADLANWTAPIDPENIRGSILQAEIATEIDIGQRARAALAASEEGGKEPGP